MNCRSSGRGSQGISERKSEREAVHDARLMPEVPKKKGLFGWLQAII
jgi:hypothetical protein